MREAELALIDEALGGFKIADLETAREVLATLAIQLETLILTRKGT